MIADDEEVSPFISQIAVCPVAVLRQTRSALPSPLRSPVFVTTQFGSESTIADDEAVSPFMTQVAVCPVELLRQMRSVLPSPLMSPVCVTVQFGSVFMVA